MPSKKQIIIILIILIGFNVEQNKNQFFPLYINIIISQLLDVIIIDHDFCAKIKIKKKNNRNPNVEIFCFVFQIYHYMIDDLLVG
jgi:hypothetical protein